MHTWFDSSIAFDPTQDSELFLKTVSAKGAVYLFADEAGRPVQLLCVRNLRQSLKRRLIGEEQVGPSKRVNYRDLVRRIFWRRVDSAFEADWAYLEAARELYPQSYQGMVGFRPAWFVHVNPDTRFPRYVKTIDLSRQTGQLLGPFEDKHAAARWIQLVEDMFDLCRYYNILVESPYAKACAYKEMGRCPAPCDGSISIEQYQHVIAWSAQVAVDPVEAIAQHTRRMQLAAAELRFESAAKIKSYLDQLSQLAKGPFRYVRRIQDFRFVSLQRGPRAGTAKVFLIRQGEIRELLGIISERMPGTEVARFILASTATPLPELDDAGAERIGVVTHHLFSAKQSSGVFIHLDALDERSLTRGFKDLGKQKLVDSEDEGLIKELQTL